MLRNWLSISQPMGAASAYAFFVFFWFLFLPLILHLLKNKYYLLLSLLYYLLLLILLPKFSCFYSSLTLCQFHWVEPECVAAQLPPRFNPQPQLIHIVTCSLPFITMLIRLLFPINFMLQCICSSNERANCGQ